MKYIALLRGINVGGNKKVEMPKLKALVESLGCSEVKTYINSGNVIFNSGKNRSVLLKELNGRMHEEFGFDVPAIIKTAEEMSHIAKAIPLDWKNDATHKTDVAYLFKEADKPGIIEQLPLDLNFLNILYVPGAIIWNVERSKYNNSKLNKIIGHPLYQLMTVRNVNTARFLAGIEQTKNGERDAHD